MTTFIITFRETLEAALIVGLLLSLVNAFYKKFWKAHLYIIYAVFAWVVFSFIFSFLFDTLFWGFEGKTEKVYEWFLMIAAFLMISHLLLWTNKNSKKIAEQIKQKVETALLKSELWVITAIAFFSVVREGVETVIFLNALNTSTESGSIFIWILWVIIAIILSCILFFSLKKINISAIFKTTNVLLLLIAAGLLAHGIVEFQWAGVLPTFVKPLFDLSWILSESEWIGSFLKAMFGYDANPSLIAVIAYVAYLGSFPFLLKKLHKQSKIYISK